MTRLLVVLVFVLCLSLLVAQAAFAVDLQAGWYAAINSVSQYVNDSEGVPRLVDNAWFQSPLGVYGPLEVTDDPRGNHYSRMATVTTTVCGVAAGTLAESPLYTGLSSLERIAQLDLWWKTDYDSSQMRLELAYHDRATGATAVLWQQNESGPSEHARTIAYDLDPAGLVFRVVAVPEPCSIAGLAGLMLAGLVASRGRICR